MSESLDFIFERANSALITQDFEYAEQLLTNTLKKYPDMSPLDKEKIEGLLARIYADEGDLDRSLAAYLRLYEREPDNVDLMINLGRIYRHLERYEDSLKILEKARSSTEESDEILYNLAKTYKRMRNYDKAAEYFSRAIEIKPDHAHAYDQLGNLYALTGKVEQAIDIYKDGLRVDANHPYLNFHLAGLLRQEKRYEEAIVYYNSALRVNPSWGEVLSGIAAAYLQLDKLDDALNTYRSLLRVTGENATIYTELGFLFEKKQLPQEAEQYYYDALVIDPGYAPAALALTRLLEKKQQYDEALPKLLSAETAPVNADNHPLRLKAIQMCMYAKDYAKAHELFGRLGEEHNNDLNTLKLRGQLCALTGETEKAEEIFKKILQTAPAAIDFRRELAEQYLLAHKYAEAKEQLNLFLKQRPTDISALMALGKTEELLNDPQAAYQTYQKVLEIQPNAFEARSALSKFFQKHGDTIESLKTANEILNLQSSGTVEDQAHNLAETIDLYERAAENYMTDPQLTKNLEQLKHDDSHLYVSPEELTQQPDSSLAAAQLIKSLKSAAHKESEVPFDLLIEEAEDIEELPTSDDADILHLAESLDADVPAEEVLSDFGEDSFRSSGFAGAGENISTSAPPPYADSQMPHEYAADGYHADGLQEKQHTQSFEVPPEEGKFSYANMDNIMPSSPVEDLYLKPENIRNIPLGQVRFSEHGSTDLPAEENTVSQRQNLIARSDAAISRLEQMNTYGTSVDFLQDVNSDIDKQLDEKQYSKVIELLADRIADNLSRKLPLQPVAERSKEAKDELREEDIAYLQAEPDSEELSPFAQDSPDEVIITEYSEPDTAVTAETSKLEDFVEVDAETFSEFQSGADDSETGTSLSPTSKEDDEDVSYDEQLVAADAASMEPQRIETDEQLDDAAVVDTEPQYVNQDGTQPFNLDTEQQNLLWCHAKHRVKESPALENYLNTADPEKLAQLFLYLRNLFDFLPEEELSVFLNSSERMQICYIIARLSGELGLKDRAEILQQTGTARNAAPPYTADAICGLLKYLRDLSTAVPDQGMGTRIRQELEQLMAKMSSVLEDVTL
ncbi:tetratricopeptide repeat protein [Treponema sp.]|uniref:tetratricopeptide repeat protein n=1 Tax=Treponema sp. TaxID=166 RepID=UPI003FA28F6B